MSGINRHRCIGFGRLSGLRSRSRPVVTDHRLTTPTQREGAALRRPLSSRNRANSAGHRVGNRLAYALLALVTVEGVGVNALGDAGRGVAKYFCHVARGEPALSHFRRRTRAGIMRRSFRSVRQPCCGDDQRPGAKADRRSADANSGTEHMADHALRDAGARARLPPSQADLSWHPTHSAKHAPLNRRGGVRGVPRRGAQRQAAEEPAVSPDAGEMTGEDQRLIITALKARIEGRSSDGPPASGMARA
jgi:hypothetical protein